VLICRSLGRQSADDISHELSSRLTLLSARPAVTFLPLARTELYCLVNMGMNVNDLAGLLHDSGMTEHQTDDL